MLTVLALLTLAGGLVTLVRTRRRGDVPGDALG